MNIKEYRLEEDTFEVEEWKLKKILSIYMQVKNSETPSHQDMDFQLMFRSA